MTKITTLGDSIRLNKSLSGYKQFLNLVPYIIEKEVAIDNMLNFLGEDRERSCFKHVALRLEGECTGEDHVCEYVEVIDGRLVIN